MKIPEKTKQLMKLYTPEWLDALELMTYDEFLHSRNVGKDGKLNICQDNCCIVAEFRGFTGSLHKWCHICFNFAGELIPEFSTHGEREYMKSLHKAMLHFKEHDK